MTIGAKNSRVAAASAKKLSEPVEKPVAKTESGRAIIALAGILKDAQKREKRRYPR